MVNAGFTDPESAGAYQRSEWYIGHPLRELAVESAGKADLARRALEELVVRARER